MSFLTYKNDLFDELESQFFWPAPFRFGIASTGSGNTNGAVSTPHHHHNNSLSFHARTWPALDVVEHDKEITVHAELPGIPKDQVKIELHDRTLVISGENKQEKTSQEGKWKVQERSYGSFQRQILMPKDIDSNNVQAKFENGLLEVKVARLAEIPQNKKTISIS